MNKNSASFFQKILLLLTSITFLAGITLVSADSIRGDPSNVNIWVTMGSLSEKLVIIGSIYIIYSKILKTAKSRLRKSENSSFITKSIVSPTVNFLSHFNRKSLLNIHIVTMVLGVILGSLHGLILLFDTDLLNLLTGIVMTIPFLLLGISGFLLWYRHISYWKVKNKRKLIRSVHLQYTLVLIFYIGLFLHG